MRCALFLLCAGIASAAFVVDVASAFRLSLFACALLSLIALLLHFSLGSSVYRRVVVGLFCFAAGLCWHLNWAVDALAERLGESLEGVTLQIEGVVTGLPERSLIAQQFQFAIRQEASGFFPRKVILNYYGDADIRPGQRWRFDVRLNRPHGFFNPGGFDYEAWLLQQGVSARGYVRNATSNRLLEDSTSVRFSNLFTQPPSVWLHSIRYSLKNRLQTLLGDSAYGGLLIALLLGDRSAISQEDWQLFSATGSNHLFVISGLHIGMISGFAFGCALLLGRGLGVARLVPLQKFAACIALVSALAYALLAGFTLPTQRAFIMLAVLMAGLFRNATYLLSFRLLLACVVVLLLNPLAIVSSGFWLSFIAVAALLSFGGLPAAAGNGVQGESSLSEKTRRAAQYLVRPQLIVFIALAVPLVFFTQQFSLLAPLVNVFAIPVVGFFIVPLCFAALLMSLVYLPAASLLLKLAHACIALLLTFMEALVTWSAALAEIHLSPPELWDLPILFIAVLLLLLPAGLCRKGLVLPLLACLLPLPETLRAMDEDSPLLRLHIIDVGQGLAAIVQTRRHVLLFDTGAKLSPDFNLGSAVVVPTLRALGIRALDTVVISHGDNDHAGGLGGIESALPIQTLIGNSVDVVARMPVQLCAETDAWKWDGVEFRFLKSGLEFSSENNASCVLQVRSGAGSVLLPGDIEKQVEAELARRYRAELASDVLVAPHHGSRSSSSYAFLKRVRPEVVVFSAGYRNSFGHPHSEVRARYAEFGSHALTTSEGGMISFEFNGGLEAREGAAVIGQYREQKKRYWH